MTVWKLAAVAACAALVATSAGAGTTSKWRDVSKGDPYASCGIGGRFNSLNYPDTEPEPMVAADRSGSTLVGAWQQDRWSDGGAKGLVAGWSSDGGQTWGETPLPFSRCAASRYGGVLPYDRASDPWVSIGPDGTAYAIAIAFNAKDAANAVGVATSSDGGQTWGNLRPLIAETADDPTVPFNDKESITADPVVSGSAFAVWDRGYLVECKNGQQAAALRATEHPVSGESGPQCFKGPTQFSRTSDGGRNWTKPSVIIPVAQNQQTIGNILLIDPTTDVLYDVYDFFDGTAWSERIVHSLGPGYQKQLEWSEPVTIGTDDDVGVTDPRNGVFLRTGSGLPSAAIDPASGQLYVTWESPRFNSEQEDEVIISTSSDHGATWSNPVLVNDPADLAAYTPTVAVGASGKVAVTYYNFRRAGGNPGVLPVRYWIATTDGPGTAFTHRTRLTGPFNEDAAPFAGGYFLGDYAGLVPTAGGTAFVPFFTHTNCIDTSCTAVGNHNGHPTGRPDPTDVAAWPVES